jgi:amino acid transporter
MHDHWSYGNRPGKHLPSFSDSSHNALQNLIPSFLAKTDEKGRPRWALSITAIVAIILAYMSLSGKYRHPSTFLSIPLLTENEYIAGGLEVLNWLISITSTSSFINWAIISFTSFRFRAAVKAQKSSIFNGPYGWKSPYWPLAPTTVLVILPSC